MMSLLGEGLLPMETLVATPRTQYFRKSEIYIHTGRNFQDWVIFAFLLFNFYLITNEYINTINSVL